MVQSNHKHPYKWGMGGIRIGEEDCRRREGGKGGEKFEEVTLLAFQLEEGATRPGLQKPLEGMKGKDTESFP